jgi:hypothetical protein
MSNLDASTLEKLWLSAKTWTLENVFIPFFLIYTTGIVLFCVYTLNQRGLANPYELHSYLFIVASVLIFLKLFIFNYVNLVLNFSQQKWLALSINTLFFGTQIFFAGQVVFFLTQSAYILDPLRNLLFTGILILIQNWLQKPFMLLKLLIVSSLVYCLMFGLTYLRLLDNDPRLWNLTSIVAVILEGLALLFVGQTFLRLLKIKTDNKQKLEN